METQVFTDTLVIEHCVNCGIAYGMQESFRDKKRNDHTIFYCPSGHGQHYTGKSEAEKLKEKLSNAEDNLAYYKNRVNGLHEDLLHKNYSIRSLKAAKTKWINRVKKGVCPCCVRTFSNLQEHFKTVHPELLTDIESKDLHNKITKKEKNGTRTAKN